MRNIYKRGAIVGSLSGALLLGLASSALAAPTASPEGIGAYASGPVTVPNTPDATAANPNPANAVNVALGGLVTAGVLSAQVNGNTTTAGATGLTALGAGPAITADAVSSSCTANSDGTFTEASTLANLAIVGLTIPVNPAPNTTLSLPGVLTVVLNQQIAGPTPGSVTVNALHLTTPLLGQNVVIGSSTCGPYAAGAPVAGGKGLALGLGALGVGGVGVAAVKLNRRRRNAEA